MANCRLAGAVAAGALALLAAGCGSDTSSADHRQALEEYVNRVEPIRLGINELLDRADPILGGYADGDLSAAEARRRLGHLERGVADYAVRIAALEPVPDECVASTTPTRTPSSSRTLT